MRILGLATLLALTLGCRPPASEAPVERVAEALRGSGGAGFARAIAPREFTFPADHGPHEDFEVEWWYFTGHLATAEGERFGYQLTFFRRALVPPDAPPETPARSSAWATRQVYLGHFALADIDGGRFYFSERLGRGAVGLAEARAEPFRVAVAEWSAETSGPAAEPTGLLPLRLQAKDGDVALDLTLALDKPLVLHGDRGLSRKGGGTGAASYYYSFPRLTTTGEVSRGASRFGVTGQSWLDREWSSGSLAADQVGWDWFSIQLDDRRELMLFELRSRDGRPETTTRAGTLVAADGSVRAFEPPAGALEVLDHWTSPRTGARYPARWSWRLPELGLDLEVVPLLAEQELDLGFRYWEGAVAVAGTSHGAPIRGRGYVELTGYGGKAHPGR
ncbi:MAG: lipocalin-like domain-containing protein [Thermoanaerobaculia bacterium]|nr:lipocalin-like domain-containing protein [Thermoanaerobaculia bacterium]